MKWILIATAMWYSPADDRYFVVSFENSMSGEDCMRLDTDEGEQWAFALIVQRAVITGAKATPVLLQNHCIKRIDA